MRGCRARRQPGDALLRRAQSVCPAGRAHPLLLRFQCDGGEPALAHHQGGATRCQGYGDGPIFELAIFGIFVGGIVGGWANQTGGTAGVFALTAVLALLWLLAAATMAQPSYLTTRLLPISDGQAGDAESLAAKLRQVPGVAVAVVIAEEKLAYLKVDSKTFDAAMAASLAGASR